MEAAFGLVVRITVAPGREAAFDRLTAETITEAAAGEFAPLVYAAHTVADEPRARLIYELHRDLAAYEAHERQPHARRFRDERARLATATEVTYLGLGAAAGVNGAVTTGATAGPAPAPAEERLPELDGTTFGRRVAILRRRRGLSQRLLAESIDRSESWMSQVERDILPVGRLTVLQRLADALGVSIYDLEPAELAPPPEAREPDRTPVENLEGARTTLLGHPAPSALRDLLAPAGTGGADAGATASVDPSVDATALAKAVDDAWAQAHDSRLAELGRALTDLLPRLEGAARRRPEGDEGPVPGLDGLRARAYQATAAAFTLAEEPDAAWLAAERAMAIAEADGDPLGVVAALYRMAHAFAHRGRFDHAERIVDSTLDAVAPVVDADDAPAEALSLAGALHLVAAVSAAREGRRTPAQQQLEAARGLAARLGADRDERDTEFGPTNVEVHAVSVAVELGDAGAALEAARRLDASHLSAERRARLQVEVARAHTQRRQVGPATAALLEAEALAPELVGAHGLAREAVSRLVEQAGEDVGDDLRALAHRTSALPA